MDSLSDMLWIEWRKFSRSRMPLFTTLGALFMPGGVALLIFLAKNPELSQKFGLLGAKADLTKYYATDWPAYFGLTAMIVTTGGFFLFVFLVSWIFGREFADGTLKEMLAVPVARGSILLAKFSVTAAWSAVLTLVILALSLAMGGWMSLPGGTAGVIWEGCLLVIATGCLSFGVVLPFALVASVGRGYLLPIAAAMAALILTNLVMVAGWGDYFPWAVPALFIQDKNSLAAVSYVLVILTGLAGMAGTYLWWKFADQNR